MIELKRTKDHRWIFQKNVSSSELMEQFLKMANRMGNKADKESMLSELKRNGFYHGRSREGCVGTMGVRASEMKFYMFGYSLPESPKQSFFLSPTSASLIKNRTKDNISKMCLVNLFSMQFPHPFSDTDDIFRICFGRLIVKLLNEERISNKLYIDEACYFLPFLETINSNIYEKLIESILEFRKLSFFEKDKLFKSVKNYDEVFSNVFHEFNYYFLRIFNAFGVFDIVEDKKYNDGKLHTFIHGNNTAKRNDAYASRAKHSGYFKLNDSLVYSARQLVDNFSAFDAPKIMSDYKLVEDYILDLYQTMPLSYLSTINPSLAINKKVSDTIFNMVHMSRFGSSDGSDFEVALQALFKLFKQAESVERISGAGDTDILCAMREVDDSFYNINVDAKTAGSSTSSLNPVRLTNHLKLHGSKYCIVVSSRFASGVSGDIAGSSIVAITAETLAKYCINEYNLSTDGFIDFSMINEIITRNLGFNITNNVQEFIENYYGA